MCGAAKMTCAVAPDGSVYPCAFLCDPAFLAGNVTAEPLSRHLRGRRRCSSGSASSRWRACRGCDRFSICHGGCPAVAYFLTESIGPSRPGVSARGRRSADDAAAPTRRWPRPCSSPTCSAPADRAGDGAEPHLVLGPPHQPGRRRAAHRAADRLPGGPRPGRRGPHHHRGAVGPSHRPGLRAPHRGLPARGDPAATSSSPGRSTSTTPASSPSSTTTGSSAAAASPACRCGRRRPSRTCSTGRRPRPWRSRTSARSSSTSPARPCTCARAASTGWSCSSATAPWRGSSCRRSPTSAATSTAASFENRMRFPLEVVAAVRQGRGRRLHPGGAPLRRRADPRRAQPRGRQADRPAAPGDRACSTTST